MKTLVLILSLISFSCFAQEQKLALYQNTSYKILYRCDSIANKILSDTGNTRIKFDSQFVEVFGDDIGIVISGKADNITPIFYTIIAQLDTAGNLLTKFDTYSDFYGYVSCQKQDECCAWCRVTPQRSCECKGSQCGGGSCDSRTFGIVPFWGISNAIRSALQ